MDEKPKRGGRRNPPGGRPAWKKPEDLYKAIPLKLPPDLIKWLAENTDNRNGFIVEAIKEKIERTK